MGVTADDFREEEPKLRWDPAENPFPKTESVSCLLRRRAHPHIKIHVMRSRNPPTEAPIMMNFFLFSSSSAMAAASAAASSAVFVPEPPFGGVAVLGVLSELLDPLATDERVVDATALLVVLVDTDKLEVVGDTDVVVVTLIVLVFRDPSTALTWKPDGADLFDPRDLQQADWLFTLQNCSA
jgi:hypothetical protein